MLRLTLGLLLVGGVQPFAQQNPLLDSIQVLGGTSFNTVVSVKADTLGNLFVLGSTQSSDFPASSTFGTRTTQASGGGDTFVAKVRLADWSLAWAVVIRPSTPLALAIDSSGEVYVTGYTVDAGTFPTTPGAYTTTATGPFGTLFAVKLDPTGSRIVYSALIAPYQIYTGAPIAVDSQGQAYIAASGSGPVTAGAFMTSVGGGIPAYVAKLSADGSKVIFCTYLSSFGTTTPNAIAVDDRQDVFVAGSDNAYLSTFPSTPGVFQPAHASDGEADAFVMKFRPDGSGLVLATLLGGSGGDSANFLEIGDDDSIFLAGDCQFGTSASAATPFPTTANAPFRSWNMFDGFVARLSPDASSLLFSTYVSNASNPGIAGFSISGGQIYAAYPITVVQGFPGLNYYPEAQLSSTAVQAVDQNSGAASRPVFSIPALTPNGFTVSGINLIIASAGSQIDGPAPASATPLGPLDRSATSKQRDVVLGKFLLEGSPDHDIEADRGYLYFEFYPGAKPEETLGITGSVKATPFQIFGPFPPAFTITPADAVTPSYVKISPLANASTGTPAVLLLVSPHASQAIQILPVLEDSAPVRVTADATPIVLPAAGGPGSGAIRVEASATSEVTFATTSLSLPFQIQTNPSILNISPMQGTTPATVRVTAELDSLKPGGIDAVPVGVSAGGQSQNVFVILSRPATPPRVAPTSVSLQGLLGQPTSTTLHVYPPDTATTFQVLPLPKGITVLPSSGTGPADLTLTADLNQFPPGSTSISFTIQVGSTQVQVSVALSVIQTGISLQRANLVPGLRATVLAAGAAANLPVTGWWANLSPAPTNWNGYSFVYNSRALPIISADPSTLEFDVQFPYDLDVSAQGELRLNFVAPDGTVISTGWIAGEPMATSITMFNERPNVAFKPNGSIVSSRNPVSPGDTVVLFIVGAGVTSPPISAGLLPGLGEAVSPTAAIQVAVGGVPATILRQVLDAGLIGVTDLHIKVPNAADGLEMLGIASGDSRIDTIPIWIGHTRPPGPRRR